MVSPVLSERAQRLLEIADDELILGWRDSEWTGIAPFLEEDVAFSSIAQNEIGHARALYELAAGGAAPAGLGAHDRPALPLRRGGRRAARAAEGLRRPGARRPGGEDRPR